MELLGKLGIDFKLIIAQIINFVILLWFLKKYMYQPAIKEIEDYEKLSKSNQIKLEELRQEENKFTQEKGNSVKKSKEKAKKIIKEAKEIAKNIKANALKESQEEKKALLKQIKSHLSYNKNAKKK